MGVMSGIEGTFGKSPAAITLAKILANNEKQLGKVGKTLSTFNMILNELTKVDTKIRFGLAMLVYKKYKALAKTYPMDHATYMSNVISTRYKVWLKESKSTVPYKTRKTWE